MKSPFLKTLHHANGISGEIFQKQYHISLQIIQKGREVPSPQNPESIIIYTLILLQLLSIEMLSISLLR